MANYKTIMYLTVPEGTDIQKVITVIEDALDDIPDSTLTNYQISGVESDE